MIKLWWLPAGAWFHNISSGWKETIFAALSCWCLYSDWVQNFVKMLGWYNVGGLLVSQFSLAMNKKYVGIYFEDCYNGKSLEEA